MGAIGLNGAAAAAKDPAERTRLSSLGWGRWAPVQAGAFGAHILAGLAIIAENKERMASQHGVNRLTVYKTVVTLVGAAATLYAGILGKKVAELAETGAEGATEPRAGAPAALQSAQKQLQVLQWSIPAFAGTVIVLGAKHGEMQRPVNVYKGLLRKQG